ncbi:MAG TPA: GAF domain-containing protein [Terriglobales bacterium]|nr:GAF domain-containing protein [Terriglobales bacterium]
MAVELPPADLMTDRRKHERRLAVKELIGLQLGATNRAIVVDLSEGGMRVQAAEPVQLLPSSLVRFQIPGCAEPVAASCELAWADHFGKAGLRFTGFSGNSLLDLRRWLKQTTAPVLVEKREAVRPPRTLPLPIPKPQVVTGTGPRVAVSAPVRASPGETPGATQSPKVETFEARLQAAAQHLMTLTSAEGAVVALRSGQQIVCRASVGRAPALGAVVPSDSGLTGESLRERMVVWCRDTDNDPRANREACQKLRLRSTVLAPVLRQSSVQGLLAVFSSQPDRFDRGDVMALTRMADLVAEMLGKPVGATSAAALAPTAMPAAAPKPTREAALRLPQPVNGILRCDACGHPNPERAQVCERCDVPLRVPELEALLERDPKISKLLLALFMLAAPLGSFYAGHELGTLLRKPAVQQVQPVKADVARPELARQM